MREKSKESRVEKAKMKKEIVERDEPQEPTRKATPLTVKPQIDDELFEKKFTNRFDKMDDIMSRLDLRMEEIAKNKKAKRDAKSLEASKVKPEPEVIKEAPKSKLEQVREEVRETYKPFNTIPKLPDRNMIRKKY